MALNDRMKRLEKHHRTASTSPDVWYSELLAGADEHEEYLCAAFYLALNGVIDKPSEAIWQRIYDRWTVPVEQWTEVQCLFASAHPEVHEECFATDEEKELLVIMARCYHKVFQTAPLPEEKHPRVLRHDSLDQHFIRPLMSFACPEIAPYSSATFTAWLDSVDAFDIEAELLQALRDYVATFNKKKPTT
jgi:hypothetical protein